MVQGILTSRTVSFCSMVTTIVSVDRSVNTASSLTHPVTGPFQRALSSSLSNSHPSPRLSHNMCWHHNPPNVQDRPCTALKTRPAIHHAPPSRTRNHGRCRGERRCWYGRPRYRGAARLVRNDEQHHPRPLNTEDEPIQQAAILLAPVRPGWFAIRALATE